MQHWVWGEKLEAIAVGRRQYCVDWGIDSGDGSKNLLRNTEDAKFIHSAELPAGGKKKEVDADAGNTRRDLIWGDSNESTDVDMQVPLKHSTRALAISLSGWSISL